jgi:hypothetical protein
MQIACSGRQRLEHDLVDASYIFSSILHCVNLLLFQETHTYVDCKQHCQFVIRKSNKIDFENKKPWNSKMAIPCTSTLILLFSVAPHFVTRIH